MEIPHAIREKADELAKILSERRPALSDMIGQCYRSTAETTLQEDELGVFVITGDIPAMWLRDSAGQAAHYVELAAQSEDVRTLIRGILARQCEEVCIDPYANAFNHGPNGRSFNPSDESDSKSPWVWERKFELDSLCAPLILASDYYDATGDDGIFTSKFHRMLETAVKVCRTEQDHAVSPYYFRRNSELVTESLSNNGKGAPVKKTGMVWSGFRPSDDACTYNYLVPANMMAAVAFRRAAPLAEKGLGDAALSRECLSLSEEIENGIEKYGVAEHPKYGKIYAYETDGLGHYNLMDDANSPSLLSIPFLGYREASDPIYRDTRAFVLSEDNPYYYKGSEAEGIGSPHTPKGYIWPMAVTMRALTSEDRGEILDCLTILEKTHDGTRFMHESFDTSDPSKYTRPWFAWANSMFSLLIVRLVKSGFEF